jgi:hypothetical protein
LFLATFVTYQIQGVYFRMAPEVAWRYVFVFGLVPAFVAFLMRLFIREPSGGRAPRAPRRRRDARRAVMIETRDRPLLD